MENFSLDDLEHDLLDYFSEEIILHKPKEPDEFTAEEFKSWMATKVRMSVKTAHAWLNKAIDEGKASKREARHNGHPIIYYRWVKDAT